MATASAIPTRAALSASASPMVRIRVASASPGGGELVAWASIVVFAGRLLERALVGRLPWWFLTVMASSDSVSAFLAGGARQLLTG